MTFEPKIASGIGDVYLIYIFDPTFDATAENLVTSSSKSE